MERAVESPLAVRASVRVSLAPERAFELFTRRMSSWWPLETHSVHGAEAVEALVEARVGGRVFERTADGREATWGEVLEWDPPTRFVATWHPAYDEAAGTRLEVRFLAESGGTRVEVEHRGWEAFGGRAAEMVTSYEVGWPIVLGSFSRAAAAW